MSDAVWLRVRRAFLPVALGVLALAGAVVPLPAFLVRPGVAADIVPCVSVEDGDAVRGGFLITTVSEREASAYDLVLAAARSDHRLLPRRAVLGGSLRGEQLARQRQVFLDATDRAVVVALETAGLTVEQTGDGVEVMTVLPDAPAAGALEPGDVIVAVDGAAVPTTDRLRDAIDTTAPVELAVERDGARRSEIVTPRMSAIDGRRAPVLGVTVRTVDPSVELPVDVDVRSGRVGGPSAGLLTALAVYDAVDDADLAAGNRVAGTGTLALDGTVGAIDHVDLKVRAARAADADVFLVPAGQAETAAAANPDPQAMRVVGVANFDDAVAALRARPAVPDRDGAAAACRFDGTATGVAELV